MTTSQNPFVASQQRRAELQARDAARAAGGQNGNGNGMMPMTNGGGIYTQQAAVTGQSFGPPPRMHGMNGCLAPAGGAQRKIVTEQIGCLQTLLMVVWIGVSNGLFRRCWYCAHRTQYPAV